MGTAASPSLTHGVRLEIAYDGTNFSGWQSQTGQRTVQGTLESALDAMGVDHSTMRGASRTDAGVHAEGQVAAFGCDRLIPPRGWVLGLNGVLPEDVSVLAAAACHRRYNPRFDARGKLYRYIIHVGPTRHALTRRIAWHIGPALARPDRTTRGPTVDDYLDVDGMQEAARHLEGTHSFHAFRATSDGRATTERTLERVRVIPEFRGISCGRSAQALAIEVQGTAFLKNMVRIVAGTLVEVGRLRMTPESVAHLLEPEASRSDAGPTAPPQGLTLVRIDLKLGDHPDGTLHRPNRLPR